MAVLKELLPRRKGGWGKGGERERRGEEEDEEKEEEEGEGGGRRGGEGRGMEGEKERERLISLYKPRSWFPQTPPIIDSRPLIREHRSGLMPIAPKLMLHQEVELAAAADNGNSPNAARGEGPPPGPR